MNMKVLCPIFLLVDIGFILYWSVTLMVIIPNELLFNDYYNPISVAWNWSFFPIDMLVSVTGLLGLWMYTWLFLEQNTKAEVGVMLKSNLW